MADETEKPSSARDAVEAAFNEMENAAPAEAVEAPSPKAEPEAAPEQDASQEGQRRGADGKFLPKDGDPPAADRTPAAAPQDQPTGEAAKPVTPPPNWRGDAKIDWKRLPRHVQEAIAADYEAHGQTQSRWAPVQQVLEPRWQSIEARYGSVPQAINQLLALAEYAQTNPREYLTWYVKQANLDLRQFVPAADASAQDQSGFPEDNPALAAVQSELQAVKGFIADQQRAQQQALFNRAHADIQAFASDTAHPYAMDVMGDMVVLMKAAQASGRNAGLKDIYDQACWARPDIRAKLLEAQQEEARAKATVTAQAKRAAAVSVHGAPGTGAAATPSRRESARETVARLLEDAEGRL